ncbi:hypothetical protein [Devosia sp.]|uniref:hypothetical protein n=1 Tax=Devosia sp. TaxID=1871048 RepID=UPI003A933652
MDILFNLLLFAHLIGLMLIAASFFALLGNLPGRDGTAVDKNRYLNMLGHTGILVALVTGPLMIWVRYGSFEGISHWFWLKMVFLLVLVGGIVMAAVSARAMRAGDAAAAHRVRLGRIIASAALVGTVFSAVFAFG